MTLHRIRVCLRWPKLSPLVWAWMRQHPTTVVRLILGTASSLFWHQAFLSSDAGDPEGAVLLGGVAFVLVLVATCEIDLDETW